MCNEVAGAIFALLRMPATQLHLKKYCSGGGPLATLCPIWPVQDLNLRPPAPDTNALPLADSIYQQNQRQGFSATLHSQKTSEEIIKEDLEAKKDVHYFSPNPVKMVSQTNAFSFFLCLAYFYMTSWESTLHRPQAYNNLRFAFSPYHPIKNSTLDWLINM